MNSRFRFWHAIERLKIDPQGMWYNWDMDNRALVVLWALDCMERHSIMRKRMESALYPIRSARLRAMSRVGIIAICAAVLAGACGIYMRVNRSKVEAIDLKTAPRAKVQRQNLTVTVIQAGEIASKESNPIQNETESAATIVEIVEDGTHVKKGDLIVQLDALELKDDILSQETEVADDEAEYKEATEQTKIDELKFRTDLATADLEVALADMELKKFVEAEYPQLVREAKSEILLAEEELKRAQSKLESTQKLVDRGFTNRQELEAVQLEEKRTSISLMNKNQELYILTQFTHQTDLAEKENAISQAKGDRGRLVKTFEAEQASTSVTLRSKLTNLEISNNKLERLRNRLDKSDIYSEFDGLVFYPKQQSRYSNNSEIEKGAKVFPRQRLLEFPDFSAWELKVGVPESIIKKITIGQKGVATIDALPGDFLEGVVEQIAVVPDRAQWYDANSKIYPVTLAVPNPPAGLNLKPGMSVMVEIVVGELKNVLTVPIQSVRAEADKHFVYLIRNEQIVPTKVEIGQNNEDFIEIAKGLQEGQEVLLYAPMESESSAGLKESPLEKKGGPGAESEAKTKAEEKEPAPPVAPVVETPGQAPAPRSEGNAPAERAGQRGGPGGGQRDPSQRGQGQRPPRQSEGGGQGNQGRAQRPSS